MIYKRRIAQAAAILLFTLPTPLYAASAQQSNEPSCAETLTEQLRRFSEKCVSDLVAFVAAQPNMSAKIYGEKEKYYIILTRAEDGLLAEAVSKANYPLMKEDTPDILKQLGWTPPENESDNWKKKLASDSVQSGVAAQDVSKALSAYGLQQSEAMSLTVGPKISDKPTAG